MLSKFQSLEAEYSEMAADFNQMDVDLQFERRNVLEQMNAYSSLHSFKKKIWQMSMFINDFDHLSRCGMILIDAYDSSEAQVSYFSQRKLPESKCQAEIQTDTDDLVPKSTVAVQTFSEEPQSSTLEKDETDSNLKSTMKDFKAVNWELNNSKPVRKEGEVVSDNVSTAFFEQQRSLLIKILESYEDSQVVLNPSLKKFKPKYNSKKSQGSRFRGVSKNKSKWQVMIMGNFKKFYVGRILTEQEAAKIYDKLAIFYHGIQAKTNFKYTKLDIMNLVSEPMPNIEIH